MIGWIKRLFKKRYIYKGTAPQERKEPMGDITIRFELDEDGEDTVAYCDELGIIGVGGNTEAALWELAGNIECQIEVCEEYDSQLWR
jgi:predicted RNase H-like HicB family nuclease